MLVLKLLDPWNLILLLAVKGTTTLSTVCDDMSIDTGTMEAAPPVTQAKLDRGTGISLNKLIVPQTSNGSLGEPCNPQ